MDSKWINKESIYVVKKSFQARKINYLKATLPVSHFIALVTLRNQQLRTISMSVDRLERDVQLTPEKMSLWRLSSRDTSRRRNF